MRQKFLRLPLAFIMTLLLLGSCAKRESAPADKKELLLYCGITMVDPMMELSKKFEEKTGTAIKMSYGGSKDLGISIQVNKIGDLYLPGSNTYIRDLNKLGLIVDSAQVGINELAVFVQKGNPKGLTGDLDQFLDPNIATSFGTHEIGSVGREAKRVLEKKGIYDKAVENAALLVSDSKGMTTALKAEQVDIVLNWKPVYFLKDNRNYIDMIDIEDGYTQKYPLVMGVIEYSEHVEEAREFMKFCASELGRETFKNYGF